jgi:SEC-C motif
MVKMSKRQELGRNDLCWCGSGKKFKKCHLHREQQQPENPFVASKKVAAFNRKKVCLHPNAPGQCSEKVIRAHTIQRGSSLARIAENGHVLGLSADPTELEHSGGKIVVKQVGINKASTFSGFCGHHDNVTFAPVEDKPFAATDEQCFLLGYRAMCRELYQKQSALEATKYLRTLDRGRSVEEQIGLQSYLDRVERGQSAGIRDLLDRKSDYDRVLLNSSFSDMSNYVIFTKNIPDVLASFGVTVQFDFRGNKLQNLSDVSKLVDSLYVCIIATETGGAIVFVWRDVHSYACTKFVQSLTILPDRDIPDAIIRFVFEYSENTFFRPSWWNVLATPLQSALVDRMTNMATLHIPRKSDCLIQDGNHYVNWTIARRLTNRQT